jgi:hypothetical protein
MEAGPAPLPKTSLFSGIKWDKVKMENFLPFATNIVNSLRKPPLPGKPIMNRGVTLSDPSLEGTRTAIKQAGRAAQLGAEQSLPAAQAGALKAAIYGQQAGALTDVSEKEALMKGERRDQQAMINAQLEATNNQKIEGYQDELANRTIAIQRESSENLSNAVDKRLMMHNQDAERDMDLKKYQLLLEAFKTGGVGQRADVLVKKAGLRYGGQLRKVYAMGGAIDPGTGVMKEVYTTQDQVDAANAQARDFLIRNKQGEVPSSVHVARKPGDPKVQYLGADGKPYVAAPRPKLPTTLPKGVTSKDVLFADGKYSYNDPVSGDLKFVDPAVVKLRTGGRLRKVY